MSKSEKYAPKHRAPGKHKAKRPRRARVARAGVLAGSLAAAVTGVSVAQGVVADPTPGPSGPSVAPLAQGTLSAAELARREAPVVSRSDRRGEIDQTKAAALSVGQGVTVTRTENLATGDPRDVARVLLREYGFSADQFDCLNSLWVSESGWRVDADNPSSSAYGIPQALTATHDMPPGYMTSAEVQIRWGLDYIRSRYGSPCSAWGFKSSRGWY